MESLGTSQDRTERVRELAPYLDRSEASALMELVQRHRVAWEVWPERQVFDGQPRQIGFSLELLAYHDHPRHRPYPGCDECRIAYAALRRIVRAVLPRGEHATLYEVRGFDRAMTYPDPRSGEGLVRLTVNLLHRRGYDRPPDPCELACLAEIESRLAALGASAGHRSLGEV